MVDVNLELRDLVNNLKRIHGYKTGNDPKWEDGCNGGLQIAIYHIEELIRYLNKEK